MPHILNPELQSALAARLRYYREIGIYDFYRRDVALDMSSDVPTAVTSEEQIPSGQIPFDQISAEDTSERERDDMVARKTVVAPVASDVTLVVAKAEADVSDPVAALKMIREDIGDCTRCKLHKQGRKQIVFGVGNPRAELMFVGEAPGADEDRQGEPFVGRAGQLLNNMIKAMGLAREQVYIANVVKCRPPGNRTPERDECDTCSPFLMRQIAVVKPKVIVALGAVAAKNLLAIQSSMMDLRGKWYEYRGSKLAVTYHPAFLLRDPRQKAETWKDLQMVMKELGLQTPKKSAE
jgi:uracil-DNA glycosylase family 4